MNQTPLKLYLAIGLGGMIGAGGRYSVSLLFVEEPNSFPFATLLVNLVGCFILSFLLNQNQFKKIIPPVIFSAISVGIIGSFTTFSTVTIETIQLWHYSAMMAIGYIIISVIGGLAFCYAGYRLAQGKRGQL